MTSLLDKIDNRTAVIGIVGLGCVGLPLTVVFSEAGAGSDSLVSDYEYVPVASLAIPSSSAPLLPCSKLLRTFPCAPLVRYPH